LLRHCLYQSHFHCYTWPIYSSQTFLNYWCNSEACNWYHFGHKASWYQLMTWHMIWADENVITDCCDCSKTQLNAMSPPWRLCRDNGCHERVKVKAKTICHRTWQYFKWRLALFQVTYCSSLGSIQDATGWPHVTHFYRMDVFTTNPIHFWSLPFQHKTA